jgi:putative pyoverdin transport system ATP-binding/permease protein
VRALLIPLLKARWPILALAGGLSSLVGLITTFTLICLSQMLNGHVDAFNVTAFCLGVLVNFGVAFGSHRLLIGLTARVISKLTLLISKQILSAPMTTLEALGPDRLLTMMSQDTIAIGIAVQVLPALLSSAVVVLVCSIFLLLKSQLLLAVLVGSMVLTLLAIQVVSMRAHARERATRSAQDGLYQGFRYVVEGTKELKMNRGGREKFFAKELGHAARTAETTYIASTTLHGLATELGRASVLAIVGVLAVMGYVLDYPRETIATFGVVALYLSGPLSVAFTALPALARAAVAGQTIAALGEQLVPERVVLDAATPSLSIGIDLRGVGHSYSREDDTRFVLGPIDLSVRPRSILFVVGGNGSGKSTLVKLLVGLYTPEFGGIQVDGRPIGDAELAAYRELFSVVFADYFLPDRVDLDHAPQPTLRAYVEQLGLAARIPPAARSVSSLELSAGQRKRLALLQAYLEDRAVYVFDEWASDQDPSFKRVFYEVLLPELRSRGKAVVVVSHDDRYFGVADELVKIEDGAIVDRQQKPEERSIGGGSHQGL